MTKNLRITAGVIVAAAVGAGLWAHSRADARSTPQYRLGSVERGSVKATVSATGTLGAVRTVEVGTQVSGQVSAIYVDFNDKVKKGQLIARIDPTLQQQAVADAQAGVARAQAPLTQAKLEYDRNRKLHDQKIVTDVEFNAAVSTYEVAKANLSSAVINLQKAQQNLAYTNIHAPIDGVVVERDVDVGQTVAASLSAPKLFVIANDLSQMQILANVDESDIGMITPGQPVTFTVQSFKDRQFDGSVKQVRLNATTVNNVVSYTAIITVANQDGKLLPGMTATAKFVTGSANDVLTVAPTALRFTPPAGALTDSAAKSTTGSAATRSGAPLTAADSAARRARFAARAGAGGNTGRPSVGTLYTVDATTGKLQPHRVRIGLSDGIHTQVEGKDIAAGTVVVLGTLTPGAPAVTAPTGNPLSGSAGSNAGGGRRGGPPGGF